MSSHTLNRIAARHSICCLAAISRRASISRLASINGLALVAALVSISVAGVSAAAPEEATRPPALGFTPKPTAPIDIQYRFQADPRVGTVLEIELTVTAAGDLSNAVLNVNAGDEMTVIEPIGEMALGSVTESEPVKARIMVLPHVDATAYLHVSVSGDIHGRHQTRSVAVPVRLATGDLRKLESNATGNSTESVRSFRAVESVH